MSNPTVVGSRTVEVHFAEEDEAIVFEVDDGDATAVDHLLEVLAAASVDEAEGLLRGNDRVATRRSGRRST